MADNKSRETIGELKVKIDVDVSEAITGLKALQREAKETARALRELEGIPIYSGGIVDGSKLTPFLSNERVLTHDQIATLGEKSVSYSASINIDGKELAKAIQKQSRLDSLL